MSTVLEVLIALAIVTAYAASLYAFIAHRSKQSAGVKTARVQTAERR